MPDEAESPKGAQFLFGNFDESPLQQSVTQQAPQAGQQAPIQHSMPQKAPSSAPTQNSVSEPTGDFNRIFPSSNPAKDLTQTQPSGGLKGLSSRYSPQNSSLHSQSSQRKQSTANQPSSEQNKDIQDHGMAKIPHQDRKINTKFQVYITRIT